jgi:hypothetical protein
MENPKRKRQTPDTEESVVVSFRVPRSLAVELEEIAKRDDRSRANFITRTLTHAVSLEPAIQTIAEIVPRLLEEHEKDPNSIQCEYWRGMRRGASAMLDAFFGRRALRWVNQKVREKTNLPIAHAIQMDRDGNRYGFDSEADIV